MTEAIFGLIGVLLGGLLTAGANFHLTVRTERAAGRAAARLVSDELVDTLSFLRVSLHAGVWAGDPQRELKVLVWENQKPALAAAPGFDGWFPVSGAYMAIDLFRHRAELAKAKAHKPLTDPMIEQAEFVLLGGELAEGALLNYARTPSYPRARSPVARWRSWRSRRRSGSEPDDTEEVAAGEASRASR